MPLAEATESPSVQIGARSGRQGIEFSLYADRQTFKAAQAASICCWRWSGLDGHLLFLLRGSFMFVITRFSSSKNLTHRQFKNVFEVIEPLLRALLPQPGSDLPRLAADRMRGITVDDVKLRVTALLNVVRLVAQEDHEPIALEGPDGSRAVRHVARYPD